MSQYILETENLTKKYGKSIVVNSINIKIPKGKIYGLLGRNGAGKTTTMCMLLNFINKSDGNIKLFGEYVDNLDNELYSKVGSLIESPGFYPNLTGEENLNLFSKLYKTPRDIVYKVLNLVSLTKQKDKLFKNYSLGMKQRLAIALALIKSPDLLILDEPINGLDPLVIHEIRKILRNLADEDGITILISSHILSEIEQIADIIGVLEEGYLIEEISMDELQEKISKYILIQVNDVKNTKIALNKYGLIENKDFITSENGDIKIFNCFDSRAEINKFLNNENIDVFTISLVKESLEDYFSNLVGNFRG